MNLKTWGAVALAIAVLAGCAKGDRDHGNATNAAGVARHGTGFFPGNTGHLARPLTAPLYFEENIGQTDAQARFLSRGPGYQLFLTSTGAVFRLATPCANTPCSSKPRTADVVRLAFAGANPKPAIEGLESQQARSNYFIGNDPAGWHRNVGRYAKVRYRGVYPGVDVVFYGNQQALEYDFVVAPHADTGAIAFDLAGVRDVRVDGAGNLVMRTQHGELQQHKPTVYQNVGGRRVPVDGRYALLGGSRIGFEIGAHDATAPVVIDPMFGFSTYLGGSNYDRATGVATDAQGNTYVSGWTGSSEFPIVGGVQSTTDVYSTAFVTKYDAAGNIVYSTYLGGNSSVTAETIAVDADGDAYVAGMACNGDFPVVRAVQDHLAGMCDAFVAKLGPAGDALLYSTYFGGSGTDADADAAAPSPYGPYSVHLAVDGMGSAYLTGSTDSNDFPVVNAVQAVRADPPYSGSTDAYIVKLSPDGGTVVYSTYLGGSSIERSTGIAVAPDGHAFITGWTISADFPAVAAWQGVQSNDYYYDGFIAQLDADGTALVYSSYLGGATYDIPEAVAVDADGNAYVAGTTDSPNFPFSASPGSDCPVSQASQYIYRGFVTKIAPVGGVVQSSCLRGADPLAIAVDATGSVYLTGKTKAADFPTVLPMQPQLHTAYADIPDYSIQDAFVSKLSSDGATLLFGTYLGGNNMDVGTGIAVDAADSIHVVGVTTSVDFPVTNGLGPLEPQGFAGTFTNAFVAKIDEGTGLYVSSFGLAEGDDGAHTVNFTVRLSSPSDTPVTFAVNTSNGTAQEGVDYQGVHQHGMVIDPGQTEKTFAMTYYGDTVVEPHETFFIDLSNVQGAAVASGHATGTIGNDDAVASMDNVSVVEGNGTAVTTVALPIRLSAPVWGDVKIQLGTYGGSASYPYDFEQGIANLTIPAGATVGYASMDILGDDEIESNELLRPTMSIIGAVADNSSGGITILNDDTAVSIADASVLEGDSGTHMLNFTVSLAAPSANPVRFDVTTANGTAGAGSDYTATHLTGVTIPAGATSTKVAVPVIGDLAIEGAETFQVQLSHVVGATVTDGAAIGIILNDDTKLSIGDVKIVEGDGGLLFANFPVALSNMSSRPVTFNVATSNGTAVAGSDYAATNRTAVTIAAGATKVFVAVQIYGELAPEGDETFNVQVSNVAGAAVLDGTATGTILNDDTKLSIGDAVVVEGNSGATAMLFPVRLSNPSARPVTFNIATANSTAVATPDYAPRSLTAQTIPAGATSLTFGVNVIGDTVVEANEAFVVNVSAVKGAIVADAMAVGTIRNDDTVLTIADASTTEGNAGTKLLSFTVSLSAPTAVPVTFNIATANKTALAGSDYVAMSLAGQSIPAGTTSKVFNVALAGDTVREANETFLVNVGGVVGATVGDAQAIGTILNDD